MFLGLLPIVEQKILQKRSLWFAYDSETVGGERLAPVGKRSPEVLDDLTPTALVRAIEANLDEAWSLLRSVPSVEVDDSNNMTRVATGIPYGMWNCVVHTRLEPGTADRQIQNTIAYFGSRHLPMQWYVGPASRPVDLGERLKAQGLVHEGDSPGMAVDLAKLNEDLVVPSGLEIRRVEDVGNLRNFVHILATVFAFPDSCQKPVFDVESSLGFAPDSPYQRYIGLLKRKPVATSAVYLLSGVVGVYWIATLPEERGKGIGSAMTLFPLQEARSSGYRVGILHSSSKGLGVYRRLRFKEFCKIGFYAWEPAK